MKKNIRTHAKKKQALALIQEHRLPEARALYAEICKIDPVDAEAWFRMGTVNLELEALPQAEACFRRVIELQPRLDIAYYNLGRALELQSKDKEAIAAYRKLLQLTPNVEAYYNIGVIYAHQARFDDALDSYRQGQRLEPGNPRLIAAEAGIYEKRGEYDKAYECIAPLLEVGKATPEIAIVLASLSRRLDRRPQAIDLLERQLARGDLAGNKDALIPMHFELANLLDATGEYDRAFQHYRQGNELSRHAFDETACSNYVSAIIATFDAEFLRRAPRSRECGDHLIFIVGMPRSGTTLVEQILDSHPQVYGCGELLELGIMASNLADAEGVKQGYPQGVVSLDEEGCIQLARQYQQRVGELSGGADFVTDKMPQNFNFLGMIAMLFPGAKVIHCMRDPVDTCLSCYFQNFRYGHQSAMAFTTDLSSLGAYYRQYQRLMAHWRTVLDIPLLDVNYETLVADQEAMTHRILEFCGLPWDEQCLKFYDTGRAVTTASYNQVRQPIYRKSVQRWKHYERYLEPLKRALGAEG